MLKKHQIKRAIENGIKDRPELKYLSTIGSESYLRVGNEDRKSPKFKFLRVLFDKSGRRLKLSSGISFFPSVTALKLAPSFSGWKDCQLGLLEAGSKKSFRQSLKRLTAEFKPEIHGNYSLLQASFEDSPMVKLYKDFCKLQTSLAKGDPESIAYFKREASPAAFSELTLLAQHDIEAELDDEHLEALIDTLTAEGEYTDSSSFSLNRDKALQKMADFQLGERHLFPLFLASGLSILGANELEVTIDSDEIWVKFSGVNFEHNTFDLLTALVLSGERDTQSVGYEKLAQALLQSAGHKPSALEFQCNEQILDLKDFPRLKLDPNSKFQTSNGVFYSKLPPSLEVMKRFLTSVTRGHAEARELEQALRYLPTPWLLNGDRVPFGLQPGRGAIILQWLHNGLGPAFDSEQIFSVETFDSPIQAIVIFILEPNTESTFVTVLDGVMVGNPSLEFDLDFSVYLSMTNMNTDLSGRKLIRNQLLEEVLKSVASLQLEATQQLTSTFRQLNEEQKLFWQADIIRRSKTSSVFQQIPILRRIGEPGLFPMTQVANEQKPFHTTQDFERGLRDGETVHLIEKEAVDDFLAVFPKSYDATHLLISAQGYYARYEQWLKKPQEKLQLQTADPALTIAIGDQQGEIAISNATNPSLKLMSQRRTLPIDVSSWVPSNVEFYLNHDELEMSDNWQRVKNTGLLDTLRAKVHSALESLIDRLTRQPMTEKQNRERVETALKFLKRSGRQLTRWQDVTFIQETRTVMNTSGPVPVPERITEYFCLRERPDHF